MKMPTAVSAERQRFHSWAIKQRDQHGLPYFISQKEDGEYYDDSTTHAWDAWQAALEDARRL